MSGSADLLLRSAGDTLSAALGWTYFVAWSVSFYPQFVLNYRRQSVEGLSIDFLVYNVYGFACYSVFNSAFFFSSSIADEYARRNDGRQNLVRFNDLFFSYHALAISLATFAQTFIYKSAATQRSSRVARLFFYSTAAAIALSLLLAPPYTTVYLLSFVKLGCSMVKYIPQAWLNYRRQSTVGWSVHNVILDFAGGLMSFAQLILDAARAGSVASALGNPVKLGLGLTSIAFDLLFLTQHYYLYPGRYDPEDIEAQPPRTHTPSNGSTPSYGSTASSTRSGSA